MSLILEALRKSEAERRRGQIPTLASRSFARREERRWLPITAIGMATVGVASGFAYWMLRSPSTIDGAVSSISAAGNQAPIALGLPVPAGGFSVTAMPDGALSTASHPAQQPVFTAVQGTDSQAQNVQAQNFQDTDPTRALGAGGGQGMSGQSGGGGEWPAPALQPSLTGGEQPGAESKPAATLAPVVTEVAPTPPVVTEQSSSQQSSSQQSSAQASNAQASIAQALSAAPAAQVPEASPPLNTSAGASMQAETPVAAAPEAAPAAEAVLLKIYELPYSVRRDLPKLDLTMHVYSKDPNKRFLMVNGRRYLAAADAIEGRVNVIEIRPDGALCEFNGTRFLLPRP